MKALAFAVFASLIGIGAVNLSSRQSHVPSTGVGANPGKVGHGTPLEAAEGHQLACFSGGCFWGTESTFRQVPGVVATAVGYTGGHTVSPTYEEVCSHTTGHAESVLIEFDPKKVTYRQLLSKFWRSINPTTHDRQGPDFGSNYRSAVWCFSDEQKKEALDTMREAQKNWSAPIVTEVKPIGKFWIAEDYHQQYHEKTGTDFCPTGLTGGFN